MTTDIGFSDVIDTIYDKYNYIAIGIGATPVTATDITLESETNREIVTKNKSTTTRTNDTITMYSFFAFYLGATINEIGLFSADSVGDMFLRIVEPVVVQDGYQMRTTIKIILSDIND